MSDKVKNYFLPWTASQENDGGGYLEHGNEQVAEFVRFDEAELAAQLGNACFSIAQQTGSTPEKVAGEIEEAFALLKDAPVLLIDVRAAKIKNDEVALDYARLLLDWAPKAKALLARLSQKEAS